MGSPAESQGEERHRQMISLPRAPPTRSRRRRQQHSSKRARVRRHELIVPRISVRLVMPRRLPGEAWVGETANLGNASILAVRTGHDADCGLATVIVR
jgi:hypothetical protein